MDRNQNIDMLKAIAVFGVVYAHFNSFDHAALKYWNSLSGILGYGLLILSGLAVPLFLIINGYLVINKEYGIFYCVKKAMSYLAITMVWCVIYNLVFWFFFKENKPVTEILYSICNGTYSGSYISIRNWFFYTLCIIYLLLPLIQIIFRYKNITKYLFWFVFVFTALNDLLNRCLAILPALFSLNMQTYPNILNRINALQGWDSFALLYFIIGGILFKYGSKPRQKTGNFLIAILLTGNFVILLVYGIFYMNIYNVYYNIVWGGGIPLLC